MNSRGREFQGGHSRLELPSRIDVWSAWGELALEARVQSQPLGNRQHDLAVRDRGTNSFGHVHRGQQRAFLWQEGHVQRWLQEKKPTNVS